MELHTDNEVIVMLRCIDCGVSEFREVGYIALNDLSSEQQQFVYSLIDSKDEEIRHSAIYAVYCQETWSVPVEIFQKLKYIYLNDPISHIRRQAIITLCRLNAPVEMKIDALKNLLEKEKDLIFFLSLVSDEKEKEIVAYFYNDIIALVQTGKIKELDPKIFSKYGEWNGEVRNCLKKRLLWELDHGYSLNSIESLLDIGISQTDLIDFLLIALKSVKKYYSIKTIVSVAGKKNVLIYIIPALFQYIDQLETLEADFSDNDNNVIDLGITMSSYIKQFEKNLELYWKEYGELSKKIILTILLHSREKNTFAEKIAIESLESTNNLNITLGIALCLYYNVSKIDIPAIPVEILENDGYFITKLILWITRHQIARSTDMPKWAINQLRNISKADYLEADDLIGHLIFCRHQYRKIVNHIDDSLINYVISDKTQNFSSLQKKLFVQELQQTIKESLNRITTIIQDIPCPLVQ